eukprot:g5986.t1
MGGRTIPLLNGDNVIEMDPSAPEVGVGLDTTQEDAPQAGVYERQVLLRTTNMPRGMVLLKAFSVVGIRGRQSISSASPRKANASPAKLSKASRGQAARASPAKGALASPGKGARASPSKKPGWGGGGTTWVNPEAQQYLLVGDTLDLGTGGMGRNFRRRFSFTLHLASSVAAEAAGGGSSSRGVDSVGGGNGGTKRRLEGSFANHSGDFHPSSPIEIDDSSDDDDGAGAGAGAGAGVTPPAAAAAAAAPAVPKRRRKDRDRSSAGSTACDPIGVVDLCDPFDVPSGAGKSQDQPLDLCESDEEGAAGGPPTACSGARAEPIPSNGRGGGGCSSGGSVPSSATSPEKGIEPQQRAPPPARIDDDVSQPVVSPEEPPAVPSAAGAVGADISKVEAPPPATIEDDQPEAPPPSPPSSLFRSLRLKPSSSPSTPSPSVEEEEKPGQRSLATPCRAPVDGGGGGAAGPMAEPSMPPLQARRRMHDDFRASLKIFLKSNYQHTVPVVDEFLALGTAPHSTLCTVLMSELLKSRCSRGNECIRRQLRAMLDVEPDCWEPPALDAPVWLEGVMRGLTTGITSGHPGKEPSDVVVEAHAIVLEVVVDYLAAGRGDRGTPLRTPPQDEPPTTTAMPGRFLQFFAEEEKKRRRGQPTKKSSKKPTQAQKNAHLARHAVERSAAWAVSAWGLTVARGGGAGAWAGAGEGAGAPQQCGRQQRRRRRQPRDSPALARARLVATKFLAEVVETCGLPISEACDAICDQMKLFSGVPRSAGGGGGGTKGGAGCREPAATDAAGDAVAPGAADVGCQGLGAAARGGLVRALMGRPFCSELARVLLDDLGGAGAGSSNGDVGGVGKLRALLSRVVRRAEGASGLELFLSMQS